MKKVLILVATSLLIFVGNVEASPVDNFDSQIEIKEQGKWAHFRDKYILGRETENERNDRKDWERWHREHYRDDHRYGPPPPPGHRYPPRR